MHIPLDRSEVGRDELIVFMANCRSHIVGYLKFPPTIPEEMHQEDARNVYREVRREVIANWGVTRRLVR